RACTIWIRSTAAVSTMILVRSSSSLVDSSRNTSMPGTRGIAKSSRRMSGLNSRVWATASAPSAASPTTSNSGSASSRRRRPSRKMVWSSAMMMRTDTDGSLLSIRLISFLRNRDLQPGPAARIRFNQQISPNCAYPFLDDSWALTQVIQFGQTKSTSKGKPPPVIIDYQLPETVLCTKMHHSQLCAAMPSDVDQPLLYHPCQLTAGGCRHGDFLQFRHEAGLHPSISGKTFYELGNKVKKLVRPYLNGTHGLHQLTEVQDLLSQQILDVFQLGSYLRVAC